MSRAWCYLQVKLAPNRPSPLPGDTWRQLLSFEIDGRRVGDRDMLVSGTATYWSLNNELFIKESESDRDVVVCRLAFEFTTNREWNWRCVWQQDFQNTLHAGRAKQIALSNEWFGLLPNWQTLSHQTRNTIASSLPLYRALVSYVADWVSER